MAERETLFDHGDTAVATRPFEELLAEGYRRWYRFGWRSPHILAARLRNKYRPVFRLRMAWQRASRGHSDDQLWSLNYALAKLTVAGIQAMREWAHGYPSELESWENWDGVLGEIEAGFQAWLDHDGWFNDHPEAEEQFGVAMTLYGEWFGALWD